MRCFAEVSVWQSYFARQRQSALTLVPIGALMTRDCSLRVSITLGSRAPDHGVNTLSQALVWFSAPQPLFSFHAGSVDVIEPGSGPSAGVHIGYSIRGCQRCETRMATYIYLLLTVSAGIARLLPAPYADSICRPRPSQTSVLQAEDSARNGETSHTFMEHTRNLLVAIT